MFNSSLCSSPRVLFLFVAVLAQGLAACPPPASAPEAGSATGAASQPTAAPAHTVEGSAAAVADLPQPTADEASAEPAAPAPSDSAPSDAATNAEALTLGVWNMEWLAEADGAGYSPRTAPDYVRLAGYLPVIDADVLVLQEVESLAAVRRVFAESDWNAHIADQGSNQRVAVVWRTGVQLQVLPDYEALNTSNVREGIDFQVTLPGAAAPTVRVLGVHLKSGCFSDDYRTADSDACVKLATQVPVLEAWIDARAAEGVPYMVVGDFNRRLQPADPFWIELDDRQPAGADLEMTYGTARPLCWNSRYDQFVDHVVLGGPAIPLLVPNSFREFVYPAADAAFQEQLSDHCPLMVDLATP
jgi:endonuclease/exonuclease/phosphatase family metal-dependent hydrolase